MFSNEKRQRERINYVYSVMCFKKIDGSTKEERTFVSRIELFDISYGGIGVLSDKKVGIGNILVFNLVVNETVRLEFKAEAKWEKYEQGVYKVGMQFIELSKENIMLLHDVLTSAKRSKRK